MYKKIGVAVAFSPNCEALLAEAALFQKIFDSELSLIHIGEKHSDEQSFLDQLIESAGLNRNKVKIVWEQGNPARKILSVGRKEKLDLLIAGALPKENLLKSYFGSIARRLIRKSTCSLLMLVNPTNPPQSFKKIVINGTEGVSYAQTMHRGIRLAKLINARKVHIFKGIKLFGLSMALAGEEETETHQEETRRTIVAEEIHEIEKILEEIELGKLHVNIKVAAGKPGFELRKYAKKMHADLLVVKTPGHKLGFFDRLFPHYLESVLEELPCNLLIDKS
jgi:nucleotide-binding universal stress UspA family protein